MESQKANIKTEDRLAWKTQKDPGNISLFTDIMAEQLIENSNNDSQLSDSYLHTDSEDADCSKDYEFALLLSSYPDCSSDEQMARALQQQFEQEVEVERQFEESMSKTGVKKAYLPSNSYFSSENNETYDDDETEEEATEVSTNYNYSFPLSGYLRTDEGIITKHDSKVDSRINTNKAMDLELSMGDLSTSEHSMSGRIYNNLKSFEKIDTKRTIRIKDKDEKALNDVSIDSKTRLILLKWINMGDLDRVEGVIATGKESAVLHAISDKSNFQNDPSNSTEMEDHHGTHFAIKIYKSSNASFKNRSAYVKNDFRFKNQRNIMKIWAEKEFLNLARLSRASIPCPTPIKLQNHVLLMSLIGETNAASRLKQVQFLDEQMKTETFEKVRQIINRMYKECKLVHADLSEFNLLFHNNEVYVIDLAQAMDISHPHSLEFLHRDIVNVLNFFERLGCQHIPSAYDLFQEVTGLEFETSKNLLTQIELFEAENNNIEIRNAKTNPADFELSLYQSERNNSERDPSPSRQYN